MPRLLNLLPWRRRRLERELDRELRYHMERRVEDLRQAGATDADARRQAALEFGGLAQVREDVRETWVWRWLDHAGRDVRYAFRMLRRSPGFAITALLSLTLGTGVNAAIFSLVDQVLLRPLPVSDPDRLVHLVWRGNSLASHWGSGYLMSYPLCRDLQEQREFFDGIFCRHVTTVNVSTGSSASRFARKSCPGRTFRCSACAPRSAASRCVRRSSARRPSRHRAVLPLLDEPSRRFAEVIGRRFWSTLPDDGDRCRAGRLPRRRSARAADVVGSGRDDRAGGEHRRLLGPLARSPRGVAERARPPQAWPRSEQAKAGLQPWFTSMLMADARHEGFPTVTAEQRTSFLASTVDILPAPGGLSNLRGALERPLWILTGGTLLLLLLASLNVAGLMLARGAARSRELTTRMAIGATRARITSQVLVESLLVTLAGGALGLVAAPAAARLLLAYLSWDRDIHVHIDGGVFTFAFLTSVAIGALCAIAPALQTGRLPLIASLKERSTLPTGDGLRLRKALMIGQLAFTLILLVGAGLFVQTLAHLYDEAVFPSSRLLMLSVSPPTSGYSPSDAERAMREVYRRLQEVPVVERVAAANARILSGGAASTTLTIQSGHRFVTDGAVARMRVGPGFLCDARHAGHCRPRLRRRRRSPARGRANRLSNGDRQRKLRAAILQGPQSGRLSPRPRQPAGTRSPTSRSSASSKTSVFAIFATPRGRRCTSISGICDSGGGTFYREVARERRCAFAAIRAAVAQVDPALPLTLTTFEEQYPMFARGPSGCWQGSSTDFAVIALLLSAIGLYRRHVDCRLTQRTQEVGVRLALGATRPAAVWPVVRDALIMVGAGPP